MRQLTYFVAASLDGYIAGPDHRIDAFSFPPGLAEHIVEHFPETLPVPVREHLGIGDRPNRRFDAVLMGRHTYDVGVRDGLSNPYPHLEQTVVTSSALPTNEVAATDDAIGAAERLTAADGLGVWLCGGGTLAGALVDRIDEIVIKRQPIVLGSGRPMFDGTYAPQPFELTERLVLGAITIETFGRRRC